MLSRNGGGDAIGGICESGLKGVADRLEMPAVMGANGFVEDRVVAPQDFPHAGSVMFPEPGGAFNVREEEGHCAGRKRLRCAFHRPQIRIAKRDRAAVARHHVSTRRPSFATRVCSW